MGVSRIAIVDLNSKSCPAGNCNRLPELIEGCLPGQNVLIQTATDCLAGGTFSADLIFLRPSASSVGEDLASFLRSRSCNTCVFGLFCAGWECRNERFKSLVDQMDDFLPCPFNHADLRIRLDRLSGRTDGASALRADILKHQFHLEALIGESESFVHAIEKIPPMAESDVTVMILGETGTGKELFARAIHYTSMRSDKPFVPVNCGALPDQLFENELFGHSKGAFTGASSVEMGLLRVAEGGTIFLDEVDAMCLRSQVKLLRFVQDREYRPLGSTKTILANVRILAATNADLRRSLQEKSFREDLYHRLNVLSLHIPPLRERSSDIPLLSLHLLAKYAAQFRRSPFRLSPGAIQKLTAYSWPGNVRELEGVIQRAVILNPPSILQARDIDLSGPDETNFDFVDAANLSQAKQRTIIQFERTFLANLLSAHNGNISRAAKAAGKERRSFQRLLQKHGMKRESFC